MFEKHIFFFFLDKASLLIHLQAVVFSTAVRTKDAEILEISLHLCLKSSAFNDTLRPRSVSHSIDSKI